MLKFIKYLGLLLLLAVVASGIYYQALLSGWLTAKIEPRELALKIEPQLQVFKPQGDGPFPTVLMFHGCGGDEEQQVYWGKTLQSWGYVAVYVDSYAGRGIDFDRAISHVCQGRQLVGAERAGDVFSSMAWVKQQSWFDANNLSLFGWSHGAWSVMDAFALHGKGQIPHGLTELPAATLDEVENIVLFYPYCGLGDQSAKEGWSLAPNTLAITVEVDTVVGSNVCEKQFASIELNSNRMNRVFKHQVLQGVDHAFDTDAVSIRTEWEYRTPKAEGLAATEKAKALVRAFLDSQSF